MNPIEKIIQLKKISEFVSNSLTGFLMNMNFVVRSTIQSPRILCRAFSCTTVASTKQWRISRGLAENRTSEGILTDGPDYTFLDGRPTPLLHKQKLRMLKQREYASQIVEYCSELQFAKDRYQKLVQEEADKKQRVIDNRLKPKGKVLLRK